MGYDLLIKNGRVVDGSGEPAFQADVAISQGKIVGVGKYKGATAERVLDARLLGGALVCTLRGKVDASARKIHVLAELFAKLVFRRDRRHARAATRELGHDGPRAKQLWAGHDDRFPGCRIEIEVAGDPVNRLRAARDTGKPEPPLPQRQRFEPSAEFIM